MDLSLHQFRPLWEALKAPVTDYHRLKTSSESISVFTDCPLNVYDLCKWNFDSCFLALSDWMRQAWSPRPLAMILTRLYAFHGFNFSNSRLGLHWSISVGDNQLAANPSWKERSLSACLLMSLFGWYKGIAHFHLSRTRDLNGVRILDAPSRLRKSVLLSARLRLHISWWSQKSLTSFLLVGPLCPIFLIAPTLWLLRQTTSCDKCSRTKRRDSDCCAHQTFRFRQHHAPTWLDSYLKTSRDHQ